MMPAAWHVRAALPKKREWVVVCRLSEVQAKLYKLFLR